MRIPVYKHDPEMGGGEKLCRRSRHYCETEVAQGRAFLIDPADIRQGIQLTGKTGNTTRVEHRGSPETRGCLTARESQMNGEYRGECADPALLAREYEHRLEEHIAAGRKGTPRNCAVIAARVKTILSRPAYAFADCVVSQ